MLIFGDVLKLLSGYIWYMDRCVAIFNLLFCCLLAVIRALHIVCIVIKSVLFLFYDSNYLSLSAAFALNSKYILDELLVNIHVEL